MSVPLRAATFDVEEDALIDLEILSVITGRSKADLVRAAVRWLRDEHQAQIAQYRSANPMHIASLERRRRAQEAA